MYGAPPGLERGMSLPGKKPSKLMNKMNAGLIEGSAYRGALLLSVHAQLARKVLEGRRHGIADPPRKFFLRQVCHLRLPFSLSLSI